MPSRLRTSPAWSARRFTVAVVSEAAPPAEAADVSRSTKRSRASRDVTQRPPSRTASSLTPRRPRSFHLTTVQRWIGRPRGRSEEHTSELQSQSNLVCRLLLEKKKKKNT